MKKMMSLDFLVEMPLPEDFVVSDLDIENMKEVFLAQIGHLMAHNHGMVQVQTWWDVGEEMWVKEEGNTFGFLLKDWCPKECERLEEGS